MKQTALPNPDVCAGSSSGGCTYIRPGSELVMDGSFELSPCFPQVPGALALDGGLYGPHIRGACYWECGTQGTADYFHQLSLYPAVQVPVNFLSNTDYVPALAQNSTAQTGQAYGGICAYYTVNDATGVHEQNYREYVAQKLDGVTLQANRRYYAEFSVFNAPVADYTVPQLGLALQTSVKLPIAGMGMLPYTPVMSGSPRSWPPGVPPNASLLDWKRIGGVFELPGALVEPTILIGNFNGQAHANDGPGPGFNTNAQTHEGLAYYYIDNVTLSPLTEAGPDVVLGTSCAGGTAATSVTLGTKAMPDMVEATYQWTAVPADPSLTTPTIVNPTVSPRQTTVYTLTVSIPGQPPYTSQATVSVSGAYAQNAAATYVAPTGLAAYEIGTYGTVTTLSASGGTLVFDGRYHVRGTVHLTRGTFELRPGTVFFVDGASGLPATFGSDTYQTTIVVQNATLKLSGATLQATCLDQEWGGVWLDGQGIVRTQAAASGTRSLIRDAQLGIRSRAGNEFYVVDTDFRHNNYGLLEVATNKKARPLEGISNCTFQGGDCGILLAESDHQPKDVYGGNYDAALFSNNTFSDITSFGLYATAGRGHFVSNTFANCGWAAMAAWNTPQEGPAEFRDNQITVPAVSTVQTAYGGAEGIFVADPTLVLTGNTIEGAPAPLKTTGALRTGFDFLQSPDSGNPNQITGNTIRNLDEGFAAVTNDYDGATIMVQKNTFVNNAADIVFYPWGNQNLGATVTATIRCNSFLNYASSTVADPIGIWLKDMAVITDGLNTSFGNGNEFPAYWAPPPTGIGRPLVNSNSPAHSNNRIDYTYFSNSSNENSVWVDGLGKVYPDRSNPINTCGGTAPGVNSRQYQSSAPLLSVAALTNALDSLSRKGLTTAQQDRLLKNIRLQPAQTVHIPLLEAKLVLSGALAQTSQLGIGLHLLEYYRAQYDLANISRLRNWLRQHALANDELNAYLNLTEATDQMNSFLPGLRPLATTSRTLLSQAAASGTTSARQACRLLRAYEPTCTCVLPASQPAANRVNTAKSQATPLAGQAVVAQPLTAYPNPASTTLHVPYAWPQVAAKAELLVYDALGRVVLHQSLNGSQGEAEVRVQNWPAGLYQFTLVVEGQVQRQQRIIISH